MNLTTADRYFVFYPSSKSSAGKDEVTASLNARIGLVSRKVEKYLNRHAESAERIELFTPEDGTGTKSIRLKGFPVSEIATLTVFGDAMTADQDYVLDSESGVIQFTSPVERYDPLYLNSIVVTYTGGMAGDVTEFIENFPDIEGTVVDQVRFELSRVENITNKSISGGQGVISVQLNEYGLLPELCRNLDQYRKR